MKSDVLWCGGGSINETRVRVREVSDCLRFMGRLHPSLVPETHAEDKITPPCQVQLQKMNHEYYLLFPFKSPRAVESTGTFEGHGIGLDPGMRKFVTGYGTDGRAVFFGAKNPGKKFVRMQWYKDLIDSKLRAKRVACVGRRVVTASASGPSGQKCRSE